MPTRDLDTATRVVHDLTQSLWLGGAAMGAVALDAGASAVADDRDRLQVVDQAWAAWHRVSTPAIVLHLVAGAGLTYANKGRLTAQAGGMRTTLLRTSLTAAALASEVAARRLGAAIGDRQPVVATSTEPAPGTDEDTAGLQRALRLAQWATVATTAAMIAVGARMGEQQRPRELVRGVASRLGLAA